MINNVLVPVFFKSIILKKIYQKKNFLSIFCWNWNNKTVDLSFHFSIFFSEQEAYACLMMRQRSENVLEFKIGAVSSPVYGSYLCDDPHLDESPWMTQAREFHAKYASPIPPISAIL